MGTARIVSGLPLYSVLVQRRIQGGGGGGGGTVMAKVVLPKSGPTDHFWSPKMVRPDHICPPKIVLPCQKWSAIRSLRS